MTDGWANGFMDEWIDGWMMDGRMDGWVGGGWRGAMSVGVIFSCRMEALSSRAYLALGYLCSLSLKA